MRRGKLRTGAACRLTSVSGTVQGRRAAASRAGEETGISHEEAARGPLGWCRDSGPRPDAAGLAYRARLGCRRCCPFGLLTGWWTPRGPVTAPQALATIGVSLLVGAFAGLVMRTRWAMLLAPAVFVAVLELVRINTAGPLVDGTHLSPQSPWHCQAPTTTFSFRPTTSPSYSCGVTPVTIYCTITTARPNDVIRRAALARRGHRGAECHGGD